MSVATSLSLCLLSTLRDQINLNLNLELLYPHPHPQEPGKGQEKENFIEHSLSMDFGNF